MVASEIIANVVSIDHPRVFFLAHHLSYHLHVRIHCTKVTDSYCLEIFRHGHVHAMLYLVRCQHDQWSQTQQCIHQEWFQPNPHQEEELRDAATHCNRAGTKRFSYRLTHQADQIWAVNSLLQWSVRSQGIRRSSWWKLALVKLTRDTV